MTVYFMTSRASGAVKIGHSVDPAARLLEVRMYCPTPVALEATLPGGREEERALHWRFSEHRIHGEWFHLAEDIEALIAKHRTAASEGRKRTPPKPKCVTKIVSPSSIFCRSAERYEAAMAEMRAANMPKGKAA